MGIELPTPYPQGNGSPENRGANGAFDTRGAEASRQSHESDPNRVGNGINVEKSTSNYEPTKETVMGAGAGENGGQPVQTVADDTAFTQQSPTSVGASALDDVPVVAADEDLIEKVWVDAVKGVITRTAGDPYARSAAIGKLQADYLQKRYGKVIGDEA